MRMKGKLLVAVVQMCTGNNKVTNLLSTYRLISKASAEKDYSLDMVCLPECAAFMGTTRAETVTAAEDILQDSMKQPDYNLDLKVSSLQSQPASFVKQFSTFLNTDDAGRIISSELLKAYDGIENINYIACLSMISAKFKVWLSVGGFPEVVRSPQTNAPTGKVFNSHVMIDPSGQVVFPGVYRKIHLFDSPLAGLQESELTAAGDQPVILRNVLSAWNIGLTICYDLRFPSLFESMASAEGMSAPLDS